MDWILIAILGVLLYMARLLAWYVKYQKAVNEVRAERDAKILKEIETINFRVNKLRQD